MTDIEIRVDDDKPLGPGSRFRKAVEAGFNEGFKESLNYLQKLGVQNALDIVMLNDRVWNKKVKNGFTTSTFSFPRWYNHQGKITNTAPHAKIVEEGLQPAGKISGSKPSVQDILPWVESEVTPNAEAQETAKKANIGNWDVQLQALAVEYGTANVIAAFAIAKSIKDEGYRGIGFMSKTESELQSQAVNVRNKVEKHINRELQKKGLQ